MWKTFEEEVPELAASIMARFKSGKHSTMATLRVDGSPRISGTEVQFEDGQLRIKLMPGTRREDDLARDPRMALHSPTQDPGDEGWAGEAKIDARVRLVKPEVFELDIIRATLTHIRDGGLEVRWWTPGGEKNVRRG